MSSTGVKVRAATRSDLTSIEDLWVELLAQSDATHRTLPVAELVERVTQRLVASERAVASGEPPSYHVALAVDEDDVPVGLLAVRLADAGPFAAGRTAHVDLLHVAGSSRRRGVGRALLREAACFATRLQAEDIAVHVPSSLRDVNRFYANWGFGPRTVRRATTVAALRRKVGADPTGTETGELSHLQRLLRRRAVLGARAARAAR